MSDMVPERVSSKFRYILLAAKRAEQLMMGAVPKFESKDRMTRIGMTEITGELVEWDFGPAPVQDDPILETEGVEPEGEEAE